MSSAALITIAVEPAREEGGWIVGDLVRLTARLTDPQTGTLVQATGQVEVMSPDTTTATHSPTYDATLKTSDGTTGPGYFFDINVEQPGEWYYRFAFTGAYQAADESKFPVEASAF